MAQISNVDWTNKRFYLHADTVTLGFDAWLAYDEIKILQQLNTDNDQNFKLFIDKRGYDPKGEGRFTPRYCYFDTGWRAVPYGLVGHQLKLKTEMVSQDELSDKAMFDRTSVIVNVDIDVDYAQNEIVTVAIAGALSAQDLLDIRANIRAELALELSRIDANTTSRVAIGGTVIANVKQVNDVTVKGIGTDANPWGGVV